MVASTWPAEERQMPSSVCRSCAILGQHTECHSHSSLTERVVPTKAFLMNTVSDGRKYSSCTRAWNPPPFQPKELGRDSKRPARIWKNQKIKEENVDVSSLPIFAVITLLHFIALTSFHKAFRTLHGGYLIHRDSSKKHITPGPEKRHADKLYIFIKVRRRQQNQVIYFQSSVSFFELMPPLLT